MEISSFPTMFIEIFYSTDRVNTFYRYKMEGVKIVYVFANPLLSQGENPHIVSNDWAMKTSFIRGKWRPFW